MQHVTSLLLFSNESMGSGSINTQVNDQKKIHRKPVDLIYLMVPRKGL
jgi:hypothetical protein